MAHARASRSRILWPGFWSGMVAEEECRARRYRLRGGESGTRRVFGGVRGGCMCGGFRILRGVGVRGLMLRLLWRGGRSIGLEELGSVTR